MLFALFCPALAWAKGPDVLSGKVAVVIDGDTLWLEHGEKIRLIGIQAPEIFHDGRPPEAYAEAAREVLQLLAMGQQAEVQLNTPPTDRYGRFLGDVYVGGQSLSLKLLESGAARIYLFADNHLPTAPLFAAEATARAANIGLWRLPEYALRNPENAKDYLGTYQLVRGKIVNVAKVGKWIYVNFGQDYRTDFTAMIPVKREKAFNKAGLNLLRLGGKTVELRGWLESLNGAAMRLEHPAQLQVLDE